MNKRTVFLIIVALAMGVAYVLKFTDWLGTKNIQILFTSRGGGAVFGLDGKEYQLTRVKVFRLDEAATNKYAHATWHLVSKAGSQPVTQFVYGNPITGMQPDMPNSQPEPLQRNVNYKIVVEAGKIRGEREFSIQ